MDLRQPLTIPTVVSGADLPDALPAHAVRLARGQYLLATVPPPAWAQQREVSLARLLAVSRAARTPVCFSHESAALLHGACLYRQEPDVHTTRPTSSARTSARLPSMVYGGPLTRERPQGQTPGTSQGSSLLRGREVRHRRHTLAVPDSDVTHVYGLPVTTLPRTMADCLLDLPCPDALVIADSLLRIAARPDRFHPGPERQRVRDLLREVSTRIEQASCRRRRLRARRLLPFLSPWAESPGESVLRLALLRAGAPEPVAQHPVQVRGKWYFPDLAWPALCLGVEFDGAVKYADPGTLYQEKLRQEHLAGTGWRLVRVGWNDLRDDDAALTTRLLQCLPPGTAFELTPRAWMR